MGKQSAQPIDVFKTYLPDGAVLYCFGLWQNHNFDLQIKKKRATKLGDYRYDFRDKSHTITINADLNPYAFLITYLHEVAHLLTQIKYGNKPDPHGIEWKNTFKELSLPMLTVDIFPTMLLQTIKNYFKNPKASSCADPELMRQLHRFNESDDRVMLSEVALGMSFEFSERLFIKEKMQRTRALCKELSSSKKYLISKVALVHVKNQ